jgi:hypothetical protein
VLWIRGVPLLVSSRVVPASAYGFPADNVVCLGVPWRAGVCRYRVAVMLPPERGASKLPVYEPLEKASSKALQQKMDSSRRIKPPMCANPGKKTVLFCPCLYKHDHCAETGSGQTQGKRSQKSAVFSQAHTGRLGRARQEVRSYITQYRQLSFPCSPASHAQCACCMTIARSAPAGPSELFCVWLVACGVWRVAFATGEAAAAAAAAEAAAGQHLYVLENEKGPTPPMPSAVGGGFESVAAAAGEKECTKAGIAKAAADMRQKLMASKSLAVERAVQRGSTGLAMNRAAAGTHKAAVSAKLALERGKSKRLGLVGASTASASSASSSSKKSHVAQTPRRGPALANVNANRLNAQQQPQLAQQQLAERGPFTGNNH